MRMPADDDFEFDYDRSYCEQLDDTDHNYESELVNSLKKNKLKDDFEVEELDTEAARFKVRTLTNAFLDQCDAVQKNAMTSDKKALKNIDHVLDTTANLIRNYPRRYNRSPDRFSDTSSMIYRRDHQRSKGRFDSEEREDPYSYRQKDAVRMKRSEMDERINGLLTFEFPSQSQYRNMKKQLGDMQEKMTKHRYLLDKYSGLDLNDNQTVDDRIQSKCTQILQRMPDWDTSSKERPYHRSEAETDLYLYSPKTTAGYSGVLLEPTGSQTSELRGRLRRLICRSKKNPHYYRY